jgi:hypothetical protein
MKQAKKHSLLLFFGAAIILLLIFKAELCQDHRKVIRLYFNSATRVMHK